MVAPPYVRPPVQPTSRPSRRRLWPILGIVGAVIVSTGLIFGLLVATGVFIGLHTFFHTTTQPTPVAAHYSLSIMEQQYAQAYTDLDQHARIDGQALDQRAFTTLATSADAQEGKVSG